MSRRYDGVPARVFSSITFTMNAREKLVSVWSSTVNAASSYTFSSSTL
jgi:hypothetical protein